MNKFNNELKPRKKTSLSKILMAVSLLILLFIILYSAGVSKNISKDLRLEDLESQLSESKVEIRRLKKELSVLSSNSNSKDKELSESKVEIRRLKKELSVLSSNSNSKDKELSESKVEIRRLREEISVLSSNNRKSSNLKWENISNWRKLKLGISMDKVKKILGEPEKVRGGTFTYWEYPHGEVRFYYEKLDEWNEPDF